METIIDKIDVLLGEGKTSKDDEKNIMKMAKTLSDNGESNAIIFQRAKEAYDKMDDAEIKKIIKKALH